MVCDKPSFSKVKGFHPSCSSFWVANTALVIGVVLPWFASCGISNTTCFPAN